MMTSTYAPATEKQIAFITTLAQERGVALKADVMARLSKSAASKSIETLLAMPKLAPLPEIDFDAWAGEVGLPTGIVRAEYEERQAARAARAPQAVPAGRYAIEVDGEVKFYRVNCPTEGKWAGYTFVDAQASDEYFPVRNRAHKDAILAAIAADPAAASARYGTELGVCGVCGRTLTDEESRARGIGPVCAGKQGW